MVAWGLSRVEVFALTNFFLFCIRAGRPKSFRLSTSGILLLHYFLVLWRAAASFMTVRSLCRNNGQSCSIVHDGVPLCKWWLDFLVKLDTSSSARWQIENDVCRMIYDITSKEFWINMPFPWGKSCCPGSVCADVEGEGAKTVATSRKGGFSWMITAHLQWSPRMQSSSPARLPAAAAIIDPAQLP